MRSCGAFLAALIVDAAGHRGQFAVFQQLRTSAHTKEQARLVDRLSALVERGQATPGVMEEFQEAAYAATQEIENKVIPLIKQGHEDTQDAIKAALDEVDRTTGDAVGAKETADEADRNWNECVEKEKNYRIDVETAESELEGAEGRVAEPCDAEIAAQPFSAEVILPSFGCDIEAEDGQCNTQEYKNSAQAKLDAVKKDQQDKRQIYDDAVALCQEARDNVTKAEEKRDDAVNTWSKQQGTCLTSWGDRETAICDFGTALQAKCAAVDAWVQLEEDVAGTDNENSHDDRELEYSTAQTTQCLLRGISANFGSGSLDAEDLTACQNEVVSIGQLDWHDDAYAALMETDKFTCTENAIEFTGKFWTLPSTEDMAPPSDSYQQTLEAHTEAVDPRNSFSFCQGPLGK